MISQDLGRLLDRASDRISKVLNPLGKGLMYICAALTLIMGAMICFDIMARLFLGWNFPGMVEYETFLLVVIGFCALAYTTVTGGHVRVTILSDLFPPGLNRFCQGVFSILGGLLFAVISRENFLRGIGAYQSGDIAEVTGVGMYLFFFLAAFGCALMVLVLFAQILKTMGETLKLPRGGGVQVTGMLLATLALLAIPILFRTTAFYENPTALGAVFIGLMMVLLFLGLQVAFTMGLVGLLGIWSLRGLEVAFGVVRMSSYDSVAHYFLCVLPLFTLMGFLLLKAGISRRLFKVGHTWFGSLPGGLAIGTIFGCAGFAAICGESMATAVTMGSVSLPEMKRYKYDDELATGAVAAGGTLGILIPPSVGFIVYGIMTEESIGKLFMAGIIPGIILAVAFAAMIYLRCRKNPLLGPPGATVSWGEKLSSLKEIWSVLFLFGLVIGGMYGGLFTPTEGAGVGTVIALIIALFSKEFSWTGFREALVTATEMTSMIFAMIITVSLLSNFFTMTQIPTVTADLLGGLGLNPYVLFALILVLYLILGMLMNIMPMMMVTLPIIFPLITGAGFNPIWFGVVMVIMMEMGQITPPVGLNVFVIAGMAEGVSMAQVFKGVLPFVLVMVLVIILLTIFPDIALWIPNSMNVLPGIK